MSVSPQLPFRPYGKAVRITADSASPPTGVQLPLFASFGTAYKEVRIRVPSTAAGEVAIGYGVTAAEAAANSVFPIGAGASQQCITMSAGGVEVFSVYGMAATAPPSGGFFFSARASAATIPVDLIPGDGP